MYKYILILYVNSKLCNYLIMQACNRYGWTERRQMGNEVDRAKGY